MDDEVSIINFINATRKAGGSPISKEFPRKQGKRLPRLAESSFMREAQASPQRRVGL
jgi:hypothetical protein